MENKPVEPLNVEWDDAVPKDTWRNYGATGRLAVVLAGLTFCVFFFPFIDSQWALPVATLASYSVLVFGLLFRDKNCSLRRPQVQEQLAKFAFMHVPFLIVVYGIEAEWLRMASQMPLEITRQGRKGSIYEWILIFVLCLIAWGEEHWMRAIVKRNLKSNRAA
jgi:hypothetical protein